MAAMTPKADPLATLARASSAAKETAAALREAQSQLRRLDRLAAAIEGLGDRQAATMVTEARLALDRLVIHLARERTQQQRRARESVRRAVKSRP